MILLDAICATSKASDQPVHMRSLIRGFASRTYRQDDCKTTKKVGNE